jgi:hypothetical protein
MLTLEWLSELSQSSLGLAVACKQEQTVNETDQEFRAIQLKVLGDLSGSGRSMVLQFTEITIVPILLDCYGKFGKIFFLC